MGCNVGAANKIAIIIAGVLLSYYQQKSSTLRLRAFLGRLNRSDHKLTGSLNHGHQVNVRFEHNVSQMQSQSMYDRPYEVRCTHVIHGCGLDRSSSSNASREVWGANLPSGFSMLTSHHADIVKVLLRRHGFLDLIQEFFLHKILSTIQGLFAPCVRRHGNDVRATPLWPLCAAKRGENKHYLFSQHWWGISCSLYPLQVRWARSGFVTHCKASENKLCYII